MSTTAMYKALIEAKVSEETAERAVDGLHFTGEVATSADLTALGADIRAEMAALETRLTWRLVLASGVVIGAMGLMLQTIVP